MERLAQRDTGSIMPENDLESFGRLDGRESDVSPERLVDVLRYSDIHHPMNYCLSILIL